MARTNFDAWLPIEQGSNAFLAIQQNSAVEALGRHEPMASDAKDVPRSGTVPVAVVAKGAAYVEAGGTEGDVTLRARKFGGAVRIADEDLQDSPRNIIAAKQLEWANGYAKTFDNAALGVTAAMNGTTVPFDSVYRVLSQTDSALSYTANANIVKTTAGTGDATTAPTYADLSAVFALVESGQFFGNLAVIAHPAFRAHLRGLLDTAGRPVFIESMSGAQSDNLFGVPIRWSQGAKTSATNTDAPSGNALMIVANRDALVVGDRLAPQTTVIPGWQNNLTDESLLKGRARKGFVLAHPAAAAILEVTPAT